MERFEYEVMARVEGQHWWYRGMRALAAALLEPEIGGRRDLRILDGGCGTGGNGVFLKRYGSVVGIDMAALATEVAGERLPGMVARGSVLDLPFADGSFDLVTSFDVLYHRAVPSEEPALAEARRVLRPGGLLLIRLPAFQALYRNHDRSVHTRRRYTGDEVRGILSECGFRIVRQSYINSLLMPIPVAQWALERLSGAAPAESNMELSGALVNSALRVPLELEAAWLRRGGSFPVGLSVLCLARCW